MTSQAPPLRPYQQRALETIEECMGNGQNRLLIQAATGTGKTNIIAALPEWPSIKDWLDSLERQNRRMLVIAHREELLEQAAQRIHKANPHLSIGIEQASRYANAHHDVVVASIQTLSAQKYARIKRLMKRGHFGLVVADEAHRAASRTWRTTLSHLGFLPMDGNEEESEDYDDVDVMNTSLAGWDAIAPKDRLLCGFTATPNRSDAVGLGCVFQAIPFTYGIKDAIDDGYLAPIVPWVIETTTSIEDVRSNRGEFNQKELSDAVNHEERNNLAVWGYQHYSPGHSAIVFTVDVAHAEAMADTFKRAGITAVAVSGKTPSDERKRILARYNEGDIKVLVNCQLFVEGTDLPRTSCIIMAKPTRSALSYTQAAGRALRVYPGKAHAIIIDLVDVTKKHSLQSAPVLYGLPTSIMAQGKELRDVAATLDRLQEDCPGLDVEGAGRISLEELEAPEMGEIGRALQMNWVRYGEVYRIQYPWMDGNERITVEQDLLGQFTAVAQYRAKRKPHSDEPPPAPEPPKTVVVGAPSPQVALRMAEDFMRRARQSVIRMKDKTAGWRKRPASPKQLERLRRWKAPIKPGLTAGEASDMIDMAIERSRRRDEERKTR